MQITILRILRASLFVSLAACAADPADDGFSPFDEQSKPERHGKSDEPRACGDASCVPALCGYDCTTSNAQCTRSCAPDDGRPRAFVTATITGPQSSTFDSRDTPYGPVFSLDNVLVYGCDHWDFSSQIKDGLEIEFTELIHASFVVNPNDPTRHDRKFMAYVSPLLGPGSYRGEGLFAASHEAPRYFGLDACAVDIADDGSGGVTGTFDCRIPAQSGSGSVTVRGEFGCPINAMDPLFVSRATPEAS